MILALAAAALFAQAQPAPEDDPRAAADALNRARVTFEYGDYAQASKLLSALTTKQLGVGTMRNWNTARGLTEMIM